MARSAFSERMGFAIWLRHLLTGEAPAYAEIGRAVGGLTGQAVSGWAARDKPPTNYELHKPLAAFFDVSKDWLIDDEGEPPRAELWSVWLAERRKPKGPVLSAEVHMRAVPRSTAKKKSTRRASG